MRILHLIDSGGLYGAETALLNLACEQRRAGHQVTIGCITLRSEPEKPIERAARARGLSARRVEMSGGISLDGFVVLPHTISALDPEVVHAHGYKAIILVGFCARRGCPATCVATAHGYTAVRRASKRFMFEVLDRYSMKYLDGVAAVSAAMREFLVSAGVPAAKVHVVPNGIPPAPESFVDISPVWNDAIGFARSAPTILGIGRLAPEKDFSLLLRAFALASEETSGSRLLIIGEGPERPCLEREALRLGISSRLFMPGYAESDLVLPFVKALVITSKSEGCPMALLQAMRAAVPVIAAPVGGIPEILGDPPAGLLVIRRVEEFANAIKETLLNGSLARERAEASQRRFESMYTAAKMAYEYERVYEVSRSSLSWRRRVG